MYDEIKDQIFLIQQKIHQQQDTYLKNLQTQEQKIQEKQLKQNLQKINNFKKYKKFNKHNNKNQEQIVYQNLTPFKQQQKFFKFYQNRKTDFSQLFDLQNAQSFQIDTYKVYSLPTPQEGTYLIKGFNSPEVVNKIGYLALNQFWKRPYRTNLNSRNQLYQEKKEALSEEGVKVNKVEDIQKQVSEEQYQRELNQKGYCFNDKIRWANVGHQYDWTLRKYPQFHTPMHVSIKQLTIRANNLYSKISKQDRQYYPESAIVNYYGVKDYMTGHLDDAEYDQVSPIYSFSFGISCVFLMGGMSKEVKPLAIKLDSGDLMIMAKNSRKCYHGVPRVISDTYKPVQILPQQIQVSKNFNTQENVEKYFLNHRLNINIRQVFSDHNQQRNI